MVKGQSPPQELEVGPRSGAVPSSSLQKYIQVVFFRHCLRVNSWRQSKYYYNLDQHNFYVIFFVERWEEEEKTIFETWE